VLHKYPHDYKVVFVGDASMSPYEIMVPGGRSSTSTRNWIGGWSASRAPIRTRVAPIRWRRALDYSESTTLIRRLFSERM